MKTLKNLISEVSGSNHDDYDEYRGQMAKIQLMSICDKARELAEMLEEDTQLEGWVESKITIAEDYIETVYDYLKYKDKV